MNTYESESGYIVRETLEGLEVTEDDKVVCVIANRTLNDYREDPEDDLSDINDDMLETDIKKLVEVEDFIAYQQEYC
jgi:hypothetical protein